MRLFRILFGFDVLALVVLVYFFLDGLRYGAGADYMSAWAPLLAVPVLTLGAAWALRANGKIGFANVLLALLAAPFVLYGLFVGLFVLLQPDMK
jgi:hypothetical protein